MTNVTRRGFAFGITALGGLLAAPDFAAAQLANATAGLPEITVWVVIREDDTTVIRVARSEMGQGSFTALPMLVAEELECDWGRVQPEYIGAAENIARGRPWGDMVTAGSLSIRSSQSTLRKAGAQARAMLVAEAASRWGAAVADCTARDSVVTHSPTGRTARYGELAQAASLRPVPAEVVLKRPEDWRLIGRSVSRFDTADKSMGRPIYASDVRLPGMLHAAVAACPTRGGKRVSFDAATIAAMPGVRHVVPVGDDAVAVVADSWWKAKQALAALPVTWDHAPGAWMSSDALRQHFPRGPRRRRHRDRPSRGRRRRGAGGRRPPPSRRITRCPYLAHVTMEPMTCTAHVTGGRAELWAPTQNGEGTLRTVARALGARCVAGDRPQAPSRRRLRAARAGAGTGRCRRR